MYRTLLAALAVAALPVAALAAPGSSPQDHGDFSIVNGTVTSADEWPSFVTLDVNEGALIKGIFESLGIDLKRFASDFNYAKQQLTDLSGKEPTREEVLEAQDVIRKAISGQATFVHSCGGTIIGDRWILTAAHCVTDEPGDLVRVRLPAATGRAEQHLEIAEVTLHPKFNEENNVSHMLGLTKAVNSATWDVALIRLKHPIPNAKPIALAGIADALPRSGNGIVAGSGGVTWNSKDQQYDTDPKRAIRQAVVPFNEVSVCEDGKEAMLCVEKPTRDLKVKTPASCYGDSGGPLVIQQADGTKVQYGIVSHTAEVPWLDQLEGLDCGHTPTHYTAVSVVRPWIEAMMGKRVPLAEGIAETKVDVTARKVVHPIPAGGFDGTELGVHLSRLRAQLRPETARQITGVVLANKDVPADALAGGVLQDNQILMLTNGKDLDRKTLAEIQRLGVTQVTLLGGPKAISELVEARLTSLSFDVKRIAGDSRLETAQQIAQSRVHHHPAVTTAFVSRAYGQAGVSGSETADALALGATAAREHTPVLLSPTKEMPKPLLDWVKFQSGYKQAVVVGGPQAISPAVYGALSSQGGMLKLDRVAGEDRVKTAVALAGRVKNPSRVVVVDAKNPETWKAAFQVAGIAADLNAPVVLADGNDIPAASKAFLGTVTPAKEGPALVCVAQLGACDAAAKALDL